MNMEKDDNHSRLSQLEKIADRLEASKISEYVELSQKPWRILYLGFLSGIAKGLGFTVGTAIVITIIYKIVKQVIALQIPYLTELLMELISFVKGVD